MKLSCNLALSAMPVLLFFVGNVHYQGVAFFDNNSKQIMFELGMFSLFIRYHHRLSLTAM